VLTDTLYKNLFMHSYYILILSPYGILLPSLTFTSSLICSLHKNNHRKKEHKNQCRKERV